MKRSVIGLVVLTLGAAGALRYFLGRGNSLAPKILSIRDVAETERNPAFVEIAIKPSQALLSLANKGGDCEYRLADADGRVYPLVPTCDENARLLRVPHTYGRLPKDPRIEVWVDDVRQATTSVMTMPAPIIKALPMQSGFRLRAYHLGSEEEESLKTEKWNLKGGIRFEPRSPLQREERWAVSLLRTPLQASINTGGPDAQAECLSPSRLFESQRYLHQDPSIVRLFYAEDVSAVRVQVKRFMRRSGTWRVPIKGLRLVKQNGQTAVVWDKAVFPKVPGLRSFVSWSDLGPTPSSTSVPPTPGSIDPDGDRRAPAMSLSFDRSRNAVQMEPANPSVAGTQGVGGTMGIPGRVTNGDSASLTRMTLSGEALKLLNIRSLRIGSAEWSSNVAIAGPVYTKPFEVIVTIHQEWDEELEAFEATIPVEPAPSSASRRL